MKHKFKKATISGWIDDILLTPEEVFIGTEDQITEEVNTWENKYPHLNVRYLVEDLK